MCVNQLHNLRAVIYTRKSTVSDGKSTRDQERENRNWCDTNGIPVEQVFCDDGISASRYSRKTRDAWEELKAHLRPGHILVACEASRAARDVEEWAAFRNLCAQHKVPFAYNGRVLDLTSGDDRFVGGLDALLAERESEQIRDRVLRGKRGAALSGTPPSRPPWGYRAVPRMPGKGPQWEINPDEAPRVREAVRRVIAGESLGSVRRWLQSTGYAPATVTSLKECLTNPTIAGKRIHQKQVIGTGTWPPIITDEQHRQVVVCAKRPVNYRPGPEPKYLCSGIATCGRCNAKLQHHLQKGRRHGMYVCPGGCVTRLAHMLDSAVEKAVLRRLRSNNPENYASGNPEVERVKLRIGELEDDLAKWRKKALAEEVSAEMYAQVEKDRRRKIAELRPRSVPNQENLLTQASWPDGTMREKRETVRALLSISVPPIKSLRRRATEGDVKITPRR